MTNEEKILSLLESMQAEQRKTNERLERLESGQSIMNERLTAMEDSQARLESGQLKIESDLEFVRSSVVRIEQEHGKKLDALFDGYQQLAEKADRIEEHVSAQDEVILKRVFPTILNK